MWCENCTNLSSLYYLFIIIINCLARYKILIRLLLPETLNISKILKNYYLQAIYLLILVVYEKD